MLRPLSKRAETPVAVPDMKTVALALPLDNESAKLVLERKFL